MKSRISTKEKLQEEEAEVTEETSAEGTIISIGLLAEDRDLEAEGTDK